MTQNLAIIIAVVTFINLGLNVNLSVMQWKLIKAKSALVDRKSALLDRKEELETNNEQR